MKEKIKLRIYNTDDFSYQNYRNCSLWRLSFSETLFDGEKPIEITILEKWRIKKLTNKKIKEVLENLFSEYASVFFSDNINSQRYYYNYINCKLIYECTIDSKIFNLNEKHVHYKLSDKSIEERLEILIKNLKNINLGN